MNRKAMMNLIILTFFLIIPLAYAAHPDGFFYRIEDTEWEVDVTYDVTVLNDTLTYYTNVSISDRIHFSLSPSIDDADPIDHEHELTELADYPYIEGGSVSESGSGYAVPLATPYWSNDSYVMDDTPLGDAFDAWLWAVIFPVGNWPLLTDVLESVGHSGAWYVFTPSNFDVTVSENDTVWGFREEAAFDVGEEPYHTYDVSYSKYDGSLLSSYLKRHSEGRYDLILTLERVSSSGAGVSIGVDPMVLVSYIGLASSVCLIVVIIIKMNKAIS